MSSSSNLASAPFSTLHLRWLALGAAFLFARWGAPAVLAEGTPVRVAIVVTFEVGKDTGDEPGEFQYWAERETWTGNVQIPGVDHPVLTGPDGVIGVVAGTTARAGDQIMALVLSGRFDFSRTYWIFNGIGGVDPALASIGSAAWAPYVIDGDVAYEVDSRECDPSWPYGIVPIGSKAPNQKPKPEGWEPRIMAFRLNPVLVQWAYALTCHVAIPDTPAMVKYRTRYGGFPAAQQPPLVLLGASFGCCRYWHGRVMTQWARDWTKLWTDGRGTFGMADMEDQGFAAALKRLDGMRRVDFNRVLFLRTASNYCMEPPSEEPQGRLVDNLEGDYSGYLPALEAAYRVGSVVVHEIARHWTRFQDGLPGQPF